MAELSSCLSACSGISPTMASSPALLVLSQEGQGPPGAAPLRRQLELAALDLASPPNYFLSHRLQLTWVRVHLRQLLSYHEWYGLPRHLLFSSQTTQTTGFPQAACLNRRTRRPRTLLLSLSTTLRKPPLGGQGQPEAVPHRRDLEPAALEHNQLRAPTPLAFTQSGPNPWGQGRQLKQAASRLARSGVHPTHD
jgi:hypothetical protein